MKQVSIIVPVYNGEKTIERCIKSALAQTYKNVQIIVVDDGSKDKTAEICDNYVTIPNFVFIRQKNAGVVAARKAGIKSATGDYLSFLDADDEMKPNMIQELVMAIERDNVDVAICGYDSIDESGKIQVCIPDCQGVIKDKENILSLYMDGNILGFLFNRLYKKKLFDKILWDDSLTVCEDLYINCIMLAQVKNLKITIVPMDLYKYYVNLNSVTHTISKKIDNNGEWKYLLAYQKITDLFVAEPQLWKIMMKAQMVCVRLGIEELKKYEQYRNTKEKLMKYGRKHISSVLKMDFTKRYKIGWVYRMIFG